MNDERIFVHRLPDEEEDARAPIPAINDTNFFNPFWILALSSFRIG